MEKTTSALSRVAATCLVVGALAGLASVLIEPTVSEKAGDQAAAVTAHAGAMHVGLAINAVAAVLLVGGLIWLAWVVSARSAALAVAGGIVAVLGLLAVMLDNGIQIAASVVAQGLSTDQATTLLHPLYSGGVSAVGVISVLNDVGLILLGAAVFKTSAPRWSGIAIIVGAVVQAVGFGAGNHYIAAVGFAILFVGFAAIARTFLASAPASAASVADGAQLTTSGGSAPA